MLNGYVNLKYIEILSFETFKTSFNCQLWNVQTEEELWSCDMVLKHLRQCLAKRHVIYFNAVVLNLGGCHVRVPCSLWEVGKGQSKSAGLWACRETGATVTPTSVLLRSGEPCEALARLPIAWNEWKVTAMIIVELPVYSQVELTISKMWDVLQEHGRAPQNLARPLGRFQNGLTFPCRHNPLELCHCVSLSPAEI